MSEASVLLLTDPSRWKKSSALEGASCNFEKNKNKTLHHIRLVLILKINLYLIYFQRNHGN